MLAAVLISLLSGLLCGVLLSLVRLSCGMLVSLLARHMLLLRACVGLQWNMGLWWEQLPLGACS